MATKYWMGHVDAVVEVGRLTPANVEIGDVFKVTINGQTVSFTATAGTVANVTAGLVTALTTAKTDIGFEFALFTASDQTTHVRLTCDTAGVPFLSGITSSATNGGATDNQTLTKATDTAATGPNHWDNAANWSDNLVPVNGDTVNLFNSSVSILYGLAQSGVTLAALNVYHSFTGYIGLPVVNTGGYPEFRSQYLAIGVTALTIGIGEGTGSGRLKIDLGSVASTIRVLDTTITPVESGIPVVLIKGTHANNVLEVYGGSGAVGFAYLPAESGALATLRVAQGEATTAPDVRLGSGVSTLTAIKQSAGYLQTNSAAGTIAVYGGVCEHMAGAVTTLNCFGGRVYYDSSGTLTAANVHRGGDLDFSRDLRTKTITTLTVYLDERTSDGNLLAAPRVFDPGGILTITNPIQSVGGNLGGANFTFALPGETLAGP